MSLNKIEDTIYIELEDIEKFKREYETYFYINIIREFPTVTLLEYLQITLEQYIKKLSELHKITNRILQKHGENSLPHKDSKEIIYNVGAIAMFIEERIHIEKGKELGITELTNRNNKQIEHKPTKSLPKTQLLDVSLLQYISESFNRKDNRFSELTKYNHIYRYFNQGLDYNIEHKAYKELIKNMFGFDYGNRDITGYTKKHIDKIEEIANNYKKLTK